MKPHLSRGWLLWAVFACACSSEETPDGSISVAEVKPTIFYKRTEHGSAFQVAKLALDNNGPERDVQVVARMNGRASYRTFHVGAAGLRNAEILVPPLAEGAHDTLRIEVSAAKKLAAARELPWNFQRQWKLYMAPYCHVDVGYSNTQADVEKIHKLNLDGKRDAHGKPTGALELMSESDDFPEHAKFKFTAEGSWAVVKFLEDPAIPQARKDLLVERIKEGRMEVGGFYIDHINKFMGDEALIRSTYYSAEYLTRRFGIDVQSAIINDVGDASSVVIPLAKAGIRYFQFGPNSTQFALPPLFYLRSPKADERVLAWRTPNTASYGENTDLHLRPEPPASPLERHDPDRPVDREKYTQALTEHFTWLQEKGLPLPKVKSGYKDMDRWHYAYPYDAYFVTYYPAHAGDNGHQDLTPSLIAKEWNETYAYPQLIVATQREFFTYVEEKYADKIPEIPLDFTGYWGEQIFLDDVQIDPGKESKNRRFVENMNAAEAFSSIAFALSPSYKYPAAAAVREMYGRNILNNDHNPAPVPISGNLCPSNSSGICYTEADLDQWKAVRQQWTDVPFAFAETIHRRALAAIAGQLGFAADATALVVFNPSAWSRVDSVSVDVPTAWRPFWMADDAGNEVPYQVIAAGPVATSIVTLVEVPALGYRTLFLRMGEPKTASGLTTRQTAHDLTAENEYYRVSVAKQADGGDAVVSLFDKRNGREMLDQTQKRGMNRYFVMMRSQAIGAGILGDDELQEFRPGWTLSRADLAEDGPVRARIRVTGSYDYSIRIPDVVKTLVEQAKDTMGISVAVPVSSPVELTQDIVLYKDVNRIEFLQTFSRTPPQVFENAFAYALALPKWNTVEVELPYNPIRFGGQNWARLFPLAANVTGDQALASRLLMQGVNVFNTVFLWVEGLPADVMFRHYVDVSEADYGITFSSRDSGVVFPTQADLAPIPDKPQPILYHLAVGPTMIGQFLLGAPVDVTYTVESALIAHKEGAATLTGVEGDATVARWARGYTAPFSAVLVTKPSESLALNGVSEGSLPPSHSFASLEPANVVMPVLKRAEDGNGFVARILETTGNAVMARLRTDFLPEPPAATMALSTERDLCRLTVSNGIVHVPVGAYELATIRLRRGAPDMGLPACAAPLDGAGCGCRSTNAAVGDASLIAGMILWLLRKRLRREAPRCISHDM